MHENAFLSSAATAAAAEKFKAARDIMRLNLSPIGVTSSLKSKAWSSRIRADQVGGQIRQEIMMLIVVCCILLLYLTAYSHFEHCF